MKKYEKMRLLQKSIKFWFWESWTHVDFVFLSFFLRIVIMLAILLVLSLTMSGFAVIVL